MTNVLCVEQQHLDVTVGPLQRLVSAAGIGNVADRRVCDNRPVGAIVGALHAEVRNDGPLKRRDGDIGQLVGRPQIKEEGLGGAVSAGRPHGSGIAIVEPRRMVDHDLRRLVAARIGDAANCRHLLGGNDGTRGRLLRIVRIEILGEALLIVLRQSEGGHEKDPVAVIGQLGHGVGTIGRTDTLLDENILTRARVEPICVVGFGVIQPIELAQAKDLRKVVEVAHDQRCVLGGGKQTLLIEQHPAVVAVKKAGDQLMPRTNVQEKLPHVGHLEGARLIKTHIPRFVAIGGRCSVPPRKNRGGEAGCPDAGSAIGKACTAAEHSAPGADAISVISRKGAAVNVLVVSFRLDEGLMEAGALGVIVALVKVLGLLRARLDAPGVSMAALHSPCVMPVTLVQAHSALVGGFHNVHVGRVGVLVAVQLFHERGSLHIAVKGGVAGGSALLPCVDLLPRDPYDGVAGIAGDNIAGEAKKILQLHLQHGGLMTAKAQRNDKALLAKILEHTVDLLVEEADVGIRVSPGQPQAGFTVAALRNKVGLVDGKALLYAVIDNVLELAAAIATGVIADRGGDLGGRLPIGVTQPEEGGAVSILVVALIPLDSNKAVLGQICFLRRLGHSNLTLGVQSLIAFVLTGDLVAPLALLGGRETHRPDNAAHPEAGEGDLCAVGVGENRVDLGVGVWIIIIDRAVQNDLSGRPNLGGIGILRLRQFAIPNVVSIPNADGEVTHLQRVNHLRRIDLIHTENPLREGGAHDLVAGQLHGGFVGHGLIVPQRHESALKLHHDISGRAGEQGGVSTQRGSVLFIPVCVCRGGGIAASAQKRTHCGRNAFLPFLHMHLKLECQLDQNGVRVAQGSLQRGQNIAPRRVPGFVYV